MKINSGNYEEYALDYLEGALDRETAREFGEFLARNPETERQLRALAEGMPVVMPDARVVFDGKEKLMKRRRHFTLLWPGMAAAMLVAGYFLQNTTAPVEVPLSTTAIVETIRVEIPVDSIETIEVESVIASAGLYRADNAETVENSEKMAKNPRKPLEKKIEKGITPPAFKIVQPVVTEDIKLAANTSDTGYDMVVEEVAILVADEMPQLDYQEEDSEATADKKPFRRTMNLIGSMAAIEGVKTLGELTSLKVYKNDYDERVVEFASMTLSRNHTIETYN